MATKSNASNKRAKDAAMAHRMKADGETRTSARCPICNKVVSLKDFQNHVGLHK